MTDDMDIVKRMAAGIVHEVRNPITVIKGYTTLLRDSISPKHSTLIHSQIVILEKLMDGLEFLARGDDIDNRNFRNVKLKNVIHDCLDELYPVLQEAGIQVEIKCEYHRDIECEQRLISMLLNNLLINAAESMIEGGVISIRIVDYDQDFVNIQIEDKGIGISAERVPYLGQPFFSTKEKGIGMGGMLCRSIVQKHYGTLIYYTEIEKGTIVNIHLPKQQPISSVEIDDSVQSDLDTLTCN